MMLRRPDPAALFENIAFDTCVYHQPGIDLLAQIVPVSSILFASEMIGAVRDIDPITGHYFDDTRRYVDATPHLTNDERAAVYEANILRVSPRLERALDRRSKSGS
jgi:4-oxalmesaconate hydratase